MVSVLHAGTAPSDGTPSNQHAHEGRPLNEATRHLCVGAYVDRKYCTEILRKVYFDRGRRLAPSYGFSLPPVLTHARRAWLLDIGLFVVVTVIAAGALIVDPLSLATATTVLVSWYVIRRIGRLANAYVRFLRNRSHPEEHERIRAQAILLGLGLIALWAALLLLLVTATRGHAGFATFTSPALWARPGAVMAALAVAGVVYSSSRQGAIDLLRKDAREPMWHRNRRLARLDAHQRRPVTVYSGFRPFVGSGLELRTWSFAQLLRPKKPRPRDEGPGFTTAELVADLRNKIRTLAVEPDHELRLPDLTVRDHIFVAGTHAADVSEHPDEAEFVRVMSDTTKHTRHFLACQVPSWEGEVVTTVYVQVSLQGKTLYLEFTVLALPPTRAEFHVVDQVGGAGPRAHLRAAIRTIWRLPETIALTVRSFGTLIHAAAAIVAGERWENLQPRGIDVGARLSVRELGTTMETDKVAPLRADTNINYFQFRDVVKHSKVIERRLLHTVLGFLKSKGIETQEYEQRVVTILNNGVLHTGSGDVNVTGVVGESGTFNSGQASGGAS